jgi:dinuclear metal center YbgI/SA1388 family protein
MQLLDLIAAMEEIAPTRHAEAWDNVGLLAGDPQQGIERAMLCIDFTAAVASQANAAGCHAIIAYHPPIFAPLKRVVAGGATNLLHQAIRQGLALYSPHTALDVAAGGTNDLLADLLLLEQRRPLRLAEPKVTRCKLVTFVPAKCVETVAAALFEAGAGQIGKYSCCSFRSPGVGTFFGGEGTHPAVGQSGKLERAEEIRLETQVALADVPAVIAALRATHPYEEPAFDLNALVPQSEGVGVGRVGVWAKAVPVAELIERVKRGLGIQTLLVAGEMDRVVSRGAVCAGAGRGLLDDVLAAGAELYVTGELPHHDALRANAGGITVLCTLHSHSERAVLGRLRDRLLELLPGLAVQIAREDREPFEFR